MCTPKYSAIIKPNPRICWLWARKSCKHWPNFN